MLRTFHVARSISLLLGLALLANTLGALVDPSLGADEWLVDLRVLPGFMQRLVLLIWSVAFLAWPIRPDSRLLAGAARFAACSFAVAAGVNGLNFYRLLATDVISSALPVPFSFILAATALVIIRAARPSPSNQKILPTLVPIPALVLAFLLAQMLCFGSTDYRRKADAIVVFGARVYADGSPSLAVSDRVNSAVALYHAGFAPRIIMSGGPGDADISEAEGMKRLAVARGVPADSITLDEAGVDTLSTVRNTVSTLGPGARVLAVSHDYHLARVRVTFQRAGISAFTVPATESRGLARKPYYVAREAAAIAVYYARPFARAALGFGSPP